MYGGDNSDRPLGPDPVNNGTGTFGAENDYDQPAAIVSGGDDGGAVAFDSSKNDNSAKLFGHRSRDKAVKSSAAQPQVDMNLVAASNIASNPNNPEFFRQAAAQSATEQIKRQPRQINKKPFIIGGIAIVLIAAVVLGVMYIPKLFEIKPEDSDLNKLYTSTDNIMGDIEILEAGINASINDPNTLSLYVSNTREGSLVYLNEQKESLDKLKAFREEINKYRIPRDYEQYKNLKTAIDKSLPEYEKEIKLIEALTSALTASTDEDAISYLSDYSSYSAYSKVSGAVKMYRSRIVKYYNDYEKNGCTLETSDICEAYDEQFEAISYGLRSVEVGSMFKEIHGDYVPGELTDIAYHINEGNGEEDEN